MKREYTIGEIARVINVARSTVINWIKDSKLKAFQLPGGNNRVRHEDLVTFMNAYRIPLDFLQGTLKKRILIVDDDDDLVRMVTGALHKEADLETATARDGFQTGVVTWEFQPHVILLDIRLGGIDGRAVCRTLHANTELNRVRLIGMAGQIPAAEEAELKSIGFFACIRKPFEVPALVALIRGALKD